MTPMIKMEFLSTMHGALDLILSIENKHSSPKNILNQIKLLFIAGVPEIYKYQEVITVPYVPRACC